MGRMLQDLVRALTPVPSRDHKLSCDTKVPGKGQRGDDGGSAWACTDTMPVATTPSHREGWSQCGAQQTGRTTMPPAQGDSSTGWKERPKPAWSQEQPLQTDTKGQGGAARDKPGVAAQPVGSRAGLPDTLLWAGLAWGGGLGEQSQYL